MDKQNTFLSINEMFNYIQCSPGARYVSEGEEVLNAGLCITQTFNLNNTFII